MTNAFIQIGVVNQLAEQLRLQGITEPTPIQKAAIPALLESKDMIAKAQTGTGKTLAFTLPILQSIRPHREHIQALILTPTRELAIQITAEVKKLSNSVGATVLACYGGQDVTAQVKKLKNAPHIVVATPGRLLDHMRRGSINIGKISHLVLDEADQMLHMGFLPEVESIIVQTPKARQTMLFSATMPEQIRQLATQYMNKPAHIEIQTERVTLDNIKQLVIETTDRAKQDALIHMLETQNPFLAVIFCRTKLRAKKLTEALQDAGYNADELHGDLTQAKREQVMKKFRDMRLQILIATDVAARGLDVEGVSHVFNYDIPLDAESYIHRIGRTGRAGHKGAAITFVTAHDMNKLEAIERGISARLSRQKVNTRESSSDSDRTSKYSSYSEGRSPRSKRIEAGKSASPNKHTSGKGKQDRDSKLREPSSPAPKPKRKSNPWDISQSDLDFAQGIRPKAGSKPSSSRSRDERRSSSSNNKSGGRSGSRNNSSRRK